VNGPRIPLETAEVNAISVRDRLLPFCEKFMTVGSVRRKTPDCGDLDFVVLPTLGLTSKDLVAPFRKFCTVHASGKQNIHMTSKRSGTGIDIFVAKRESADLFETFPSNWWTLVVCRTGSREHNIKICQAAERLGMKWKPYEGIIAADGNLIPIENEQHLFELVELPFLEPEDRR